MKRLILTAVILSSLTACNKKPVGESTEQASDVANMDLADLKPKGDTSEKADWPLDAATEQKAEAAAIAHDQYDPDSIYTGSDNIAIPSPRLKRRLLPGETVEVQFRPEGFVPIYKIIASTGPAGTHLRIVAETNNDVIDAVKINQGDCKIAGVEPYTVKFPQRVHYGMVFDLALENCTATQINNVTLSTVQGQLSHRPMEE